MTDTAFPFDSDEFLEYEADSPWTHIGTNPGGATSAIGLWYGDSGYRSIWHGTIDMSEWEPPEGEELTGLSVKFFVVSFSAPSRAVGIYGEDYESWTTRSPLGSGTAPGTVNNSFSVSIPKAVLEDALAGNGIIDLYADVPDYTSGDWVEIANTENTFPEVRPELVVETTPVGGGQPSGSPEIVSVTPAHDSADVVISYSGDDADGFEYRIDEGSPVDVEDDLSFAIPGLSSATQYDLQVRAYNSNGPGEWSEPYPFETLAEPEVHSVQATSVTMSSIVPTCVARDETDVVFIVTGRTPSTMTRAQALAIIAGGEE